MSLVSARIYRCREEFQDLFRQHMGTLKSEVVETASDAEWQAIDEAETKIMTAVSVQLDEMVDDLERTIQTRFEADFNKVEEILALAEDVEMQAKQEYLAGMVRTYVLLDLPLPEGAEYYK